MPEIAHQRDRVAAERIGHHQRAEEKREEGEEVEKDLKEELIMEVLSRMERIKAKMRFARTKSKRERIEQCRKEASQTWTSSFQGKEETVDYYQRILKSKYL